MFNCLTSRQNDGVAKEFGVAIHRDVRAGSIDGTWAAYSNGSDIAGDDGDQVPMYHVGGGSEVVDKVPV